MSIQSKVINVRLSTEQAGRFQRLLGECQRRSDDVAKQPV